MLKKILIVYGLLNLVNNRIEVMVLKFQIQFYKLKD